MTTPTQRVTRRSGLEVAGLIALVLALLVVFAWPLVSATRASAATPGVQLSSDGVTFSPVYNGTLFDSTARMVPMSSQSGRFWVKNASAEPAFLRVSVGDVTGGGNGFSAVLTLKADTPTTTGSPVGIDSAVPCYVLAQGQLLAPGAIARVDTTLAMGDLNGLDGQTQNVGFDILVGLSSAATGSIPSTTCLTNSGTVPGTPGGGSGGGSGGGGGIGGSGGGAHVGIGGGHGTGTATPATSPIDGDPSGIADVPATSGGSAFAGEGDALTILIPNTGRFYQERNVMLWLFGAIAGGVLCALLARRRNRNEQEVVVAWPARGRLSGREAWSTT